MKRAAIILTLLLLLLAGAAYADKVVWVWTAQATPAQTTLDTVGYQTAQITIYAASGSPDGTVTIYLVPPGGGALVSLATYATPSTPKTFRGPVGTALAIALTANTTGTVAVNAVLK